MKLGNEISKILDRYLPADGVGTEREKVRMLLHNEISVLVAKFIPEKKCEDCNGSLPEGMNHRCYDCYDEIYFS